MEINFDVDENLIKEANITKADLSSNLWEIYMGAYGSILDEITILAKDIPHTEEENKQFETAFDNLCENLWHQMSFYNASYLAMPYMLDLLEQKEEQQDFKWQLRIISEMGMIVVTDISVNHYNKVEDAELTGNYDKCLLVLREKTKSFIMKYLNEIKQSDCNDKSYFYTGVLAVLDDRMAAFTLTSLLYNEMYVVCASCEDWNEDMPAISDGGIDEIEPADSVIGMWDGKSLEDTYLWFSNFLHILGDDNAVNALSYYYGTYTCPECGKKALVMDLAKKYFGL